MIIDCHVHMIEEKGYEDRLVKEMDKLKLDKICLLAMQPIPFWGSRAASNERLLEACARYPERLIPFGFVDLGMDPPTIVDRLFTAGCKGLKVTRTRLPYNDDRLLDYYRRAAIYGMPILFHTGTVLRTPDDRYYDVDCSRMRPIFLDRIARLFPELSLIGAHLGNPWYDEAAMTLFWNENVYFDLSGTILKRKNKEWFDQTLWWNESVMGKLAQDEGTFYANVGQHPFSRICFGSDVPIHEMAGVVEEYRALIKAMNMPEEVVRRVMGGNIQRMLGL